MWMKKRPPKLMTAEQLAELAALAALPDDAVDTSDAPEVLDWRGGKRGLFHQRRKAQRDGQV